MAQNFHVGTGKALRHLSDIVNFCACKGVLFASQQPAQYLNSRRKFRQWNVQPFNQSATGSLVEFLRTICSSNDQDPFVLCRGRPIQLHQEFCFQSPGTLMLRFRPLTKKRIYFIYENDGRLMNRSHCKKRANHFLTIPDPFGSQGRSANAEKGRFGLRSDALSDQCLSRSRWTKQEYSSGGSTQSREDIRP
ncbi:AAEL009256-PA [Aedes aegypti]|uniref:AAEL009256-PA n=1 Tax=Aedes aegypti TaxID=7159 RepID=Q16WC9_AEDAE|nr:AAEL009256-PA [Aedes aegypti]